MDNFKDRLNMLNVLLKEMGSTLLNTIELAGTYTKLAGIHTKEPEKSIVEKIKECNEDAKILNKKYKPWADSVPENFGPDSFGGTDFPDPNDESMRPISYEPITTPEIDLALDELYKNNPDIQQEPYRSAWINTFNGHKFYPLNPNEKHIDIFDIAHALSNICRFTGHVKEFYSVAQHCVLVSHICNSENALIGLLHDASEAYIQDISSPVKRTTEFKEYKKIEAKLQKAIYKKFGCPEIEPPDVKAADIKLLSTEARDLMINLHRDWKLEVSPLPFNITPLPPVEARALFMERFTELYKSK